MVENLGISARMHIARLMNNQVKGPKKNDDKSAVAMLKKGDWHENVWQLVVNLDKSHERSGRPDKNRDTHHELKRGPAGRRSSNARHLLKRRRSGKSKVPAKQRGSWPKVYSKVKEHERATFFSPSENRCLPASTLKPEEREFVVDSGASMHMTSKKDLSDAEMDTLTKSCSPTIVITANGEVQTHEEAIVNVKELDIFFTMKVLENTPAVLSLGKLCDENVYSHEWINGPKTTSH